MPALTYSYNDSFSKQCNHIAIVVSDVGRSLHFYTNIIGMQQINRPDFDRYVLSNNIPCTIGFIYKIDIGIMNLAAKQLLKYRYIECCTSKT